MSCFIWFLRRLNQLYSLPLQRSVRQHCVLLRLNGCDAVSLKGQYWWSRFDISRWISSRPSWRYPVNYRTQSQLNPEESFQSLPGNFSLLVWDIHLTLQPIMQKKEKKMLSFWHCLLSLSFPFVLISPLAASLLLRKIVFHQFHKLFSVALFTCHLTLITSCSASTHCDKIFISCISR